MSFESILSEVNEGHVAAVYLLYGEEYERRREFLHRLRRRLGIDDDTSSLNYQKFVGDSATADAVLSACSTRTFDGRSRLVVAVDPPDLEGGDQEEARKWVSYVENPNQSNCLCIAVAKVDKRRRLYRRVSSAEYQHARAVPCERPQGKQLKKWIKSTLSRRGKDISARALEMLSDYDVPLSLLRQELDKMCTYVGDRGTISADDVSALACLPPQQNIFDLVDAVGERDSKKAVMQTERMLQDGAEPLMLLGMIARQIRLIWHTQHYLSRGYTVSKLASRMQLPDWVVRKYVRQSRNFTPRQLETTMEVMRECDLGIKQGRWPAEMAIERLVVMLANPEVRTEKAGLGPDG